MCDCEKQMRRIFFWGEDVGVNQKLKEQNVKNLNLYSFMSKHVLHRKHYAAENIKQKSSCVS